jgi:cytochrome c-type biogenesis protein CcmH
VSSTARTFVDAGNGERGEHMNRRAFVVAGAAGAAAFARTLSPATLGAQRQQSNFAPMDDGSYRVVRLPPRPDASPLLDNDARDALEHRIHCMCGCSLDVYTCRTTDFSCTISPAMHRDVQEMVANGYDADEILAAFENVYGERVRMAPKREGFNWLGYLMPFIALVIGAFVVTLMLRRWSRAAAVAAASETAGNSGMVSEQARQLEGTPEELARVHAALRADDDDEGDS